MSTFRRRKLPKISARTGHVAAADGNVMVIWGGYQNSDVEHHPFQYLLPQELWLFNVDVEKWTLFLTNGQCPPGTSGAVGHILGNNFYIFAGHIQYGSTNSIYKLDFGTRKWTKLCPPLPIPSPRDKFASWTVDEKIYCFGGYGPEISNSQNGREYFVFDQSSRSGWNNQLVMYDTCANKWTNIACQGVAPVPRAAHKAARLGEKVYVFGGRHRQHRMNDLHSLDLTSMTWSGELKITSPVPCGRSWHTFTEVLPVHVFLFGGFTQNNEPCNDSWLLDTTTLQWTQLFRHVKQPRIWHTACITASEDILVFGGCCNNFLDPEVKAIHSGEICVFRVKPKPLLRLCVEALNENADKDQWEQLPKDLRELVLKFHTGHKVKREKNSNL